MDELFRRAKDGAVLAARDLHIILDAMPTAVSWGTFPDGTIRFVNRAFVRLFGYPAEHFKTVTQWFEEVYETQLERDTINQYRSKLENAASARITEIGPLECRVRRFDGSFVTVLNREVMLHELGIGITSFEDISERKQAEDAMRRIALEDPLTGLGNRRALYDAWHTEQQAAAAAATDDPTVVIIVADLNGFKAINDSLGHEAGDEVLKMMSERIQACVRTSDVVSRIGGDEFAIIISDLRNPHYAEVISQRICDTISTPVDFQGKPLRLGVSIGLSLYPRDGDDLATLLRSADRALYRQKRLGKTGWMWFLHPFFPAFSKQ